MEIVEWLQKRLGKISLKSAIIFTLVNTVFLLMFRDVFIRITMFLFCAVILYFIGKNPFFDADPVPFVSGIHLLLYGWLPTIQFIVWTIPASDVIANRFNQWSIINFSCLALSLSITYLFGIKGAIALIMLIVLHNFFRLMLNILFFKRPLLEVRSVFTHVIIYLVLINVISFLF